MKALLVESPLRCKFQICAIHRFALFAINVAKLQDSQVALLLDSGMGLL
jgi:hypothetical protein